MRGAGILYSASSALVKIRIVLSMILKSSLWHFFFPDGQGITPR